MFSKVKPENSTPKRNYKITENIYLYENIHKSDS